jgi:hypothetical protein
MATMGHLAVDMIIELLHITIEPDEEVVTTDAGSIPTLYENDETSDSKSMGLA